MVNLITSYKKFWEPISWSRSFCAYSSFCGPKSFDWRPLCFSFVHPFPQSTNTTKSAHFWAVLQGDHHRFLRRFFVNTFIFSLNGLYSSVVQRDEFLWYTYPFTHSDQSPVSILPPISCVYLKSLVPFILLGCRKARQSSVSVRTCFLFQAIWSPQKAWDKAGKSLYFTDCECEWLSLCILWLFSCCTDYSHSSSCIQACKCDCLR